LLLQRPTDVVDREVLLAQLDDFLARGDALGGSVRPLEHRQEECAVWVLPKPVAEHSKDSRGVAEALGGLGGRDPLEEVGAEGFVLAVGGVGRFEEDLPDIDVCYLFDLFQRLTRHISWGWP
jgi:hypothetical protein